MLEVEIKLAVEAEEVADSLRSRGAELLATEHHRDLYYQHPLKDFASTDEALRIRVEPDCATITYKGPKIGTSGKVRKELESRVERPESLASILETLGFRNAGEVRKSRDRWQLEGVTVALDRVEGLGDFVELELLVEEGDREAALERLRKLASSLGLSPDEEIRCSYLEMLLDR